MKTERSGSEQLVFTSNDTRRDRIGVRRRDVLALLAALGVPAHVLAQDPVKILPKNYRIAFENDKVRVLEYVSRPGMGPCGEAMHYHPRHIDIVLSDFRFKTTQNGKVTTGKVKAGDVLWFEAETHEVENLDKTPTRAFMIEMKDETWKPSTGLS